MEETLLYVKPFVTVDACHVRDRSGGIIYSAIVQAGNDTTIPIAFGVCHGTENYDNWSWIMRNISNAFPTLKEKNFVFVSDKDKGLRKTLHECFPYNLSTNCLFHIKHFPAAFNHADLVTLLVDKYVLICPMRIVIYLLNRVMKSIMNDQ